MAQITINPANLKIELTKNEQFWGLHRSLIVPGKQVVGAQALGKGWLRTLGLRAPGTGLPGIMVAGTFRRRGDKSFVSWTRGTQPLQINLTGNKYDRIIVGVKDAEALADTINSAITGC